MNSNPNPKSDPPACGTDCGCGTTRRDALKHIGLGVAAALAPWRIAPAVAGPFEPSDFQKLVPADKKLSPAWLRSLFERGTPAVYRGADLKYIGMPVGGITAGQLYLGGDGTLWHWDIFNRTAGTGDGHYAHPVTPAAPLEQGFSLRILGGQAGAPPLDAKGFAEVSFLGQYPVGTVEYRDPACPVAVTLEAFSPFTPLDVDDSSLPATVMHFTLKNTGTQRVELELTGHLENAVGLLTGSGSGGTRKNRVARDAGPTLLLECSAAPPAAVAPGEVRKPILFEDFEGENYGKWAVEGEAFGKGPARGAPNAEQRLVGFAGKALANSWPGSDVPQGKLTSPLFTVERHYINFLVGGGNHPHQTCINLLVDGKAVRTQTGKNTDLMTWAAWDVRDLAGKTARIEIVDHHSGGWGHIDIDHIEFADVQRLPITDFASQPDAGTMALALLDPADADRGAAAVARKAPGGEWVEEQVDSKPMGEKLVGALTRKLALNAGESGTATFVVAWHFPNLTLDGIKGGAGRHYAKRFADATAVAAHVAKNFDRLDRQTRLWRSTWYDSTLPHWFLDRTLASAATLATSTAYRFADGRFYGWEGVGCCAGTCTHVWHYEQAMGRLFPPLDVLLRERADFNPDISFRADGMIDHRGEFNAGQAVDGQAGTLLRAYRDHQTSPDDTFLRRNYPAIKKATQWLLAQDAHDGTADGILAGAQHNTLDAEWYGPVAWLSGLYLASLRAVEEMATEMSDPAFAAQCRATFEAGQKKFVATLFDGEYFINKPDPKHPEAINSGTGCEIDQVFGQSWGFQVGLGRVLPEAQTRSALQSLWKYNFTPDVGPYRNANKAGRWYAMPGEAGLLMCTFPRSDWDYEKARGKGPEWATGYFNECMNGFEHQVAGHMIWEGMVQEGLAVERAIHDRYNASHRNPWNEVECGDHYARSMASYGVYVAACGFEYHGPRGHIAFAPRLTPANFKAAFTTAQGWGSFAQQAGGGSFKAQLDLKWGKLRVRSLEFTLPDHAAIKEVAVTANGRPAEATHKLEGNRLRVTLAADATVEQGQRIEVSAS